MKMKIKAWPREGWGGWKECAGLKEQRSRMQNLTAPLIMMLPSETLEWMKGDRCRGCFHKTISTGLLQIHGHELTGFVRKNSQTQSHANSSQTKAFLVMHTQKTYRRHTHKTSKIWALFQNLVRCLAVCGPHRQNKKQNQLLKFTALKQSYTNTQAVTKLSFSFHFTSGSSSVDFFSSSLF